MEITIMFLTIGLLLLFTIGYWFSIKNNERTVIQHSEEIFNTGEDALYDAPTENDKIGFKNYADVISDKIRESDSFVVYGIYGSWGSGKTSLMKMICNNLNEEKTIWFDAWKFKGKVSIFDALCQIMGKELSKDALIGATPRGNNIRNWMCKGKSGDVKYDVLKIQEFKYNMKKLLAYVNENKSEKIVIFIDDLDRCEPASAIDFLENLKVFFDIPRLCFIIGVNYEILINEVHKKYEKGSSNKNSFSEEYLAKIINVPFFLPRLDSKTIKRYISKNIFIPELKQAGEVFSIGNDGSLRSVKRLINAYVILLGIAAARNMKLDPVLLAKMVVIQYRFRDEYQKIVIDPNYLIRTQDEVLGVVRRINRSSIAFKESRESGGIKPELKPILEIRPMFSKENIDMYITFVQSEDKTKQDNAISDYPRLISEGRFDLIESLELLPPDTRVDIRKYIMEKYPKCNKKMKYELIRIINSPSTDEGIQFQKSAILDNKSEPIELRIEALQYLIREGVDLEEYARHTVQSYTHSNENERKYIRNMALTLIQNNQNYGIDIMLDIISTMEPTDLKQSETIDLITTLANSTDKKTVDILEKYLKLRDSVIVISALNAIGKIDVNALLEWKTQFISDEVMRGKYISAIANNAHATSRILEFFKPEEIIDIMQGETDVQDLRDEINMLKLLAFRAIRRYLDSLHDDKEESVLDSYLTQIYVYLAALERHAEHWSVRDAAKHTRMEIVDLNKRRIRYSSKNEE